MKKPIKLLDKESFVNELQNIDFIEVEDHEEHGVLVLTNKSMGWIKKRIFCCDWLFQIQLHKKKDAWFILELENLINCRNAEEGEEILRLINKFTEVDE